MRKPLLCLLYKPIRLKFNTVFILVLALCSQALAGAWTQPQRHYFFKVASSFFSTDEEFNHQGKRLEIMDEQTAFENASFRDINVNTYLEYGLTDRLTLVATLPFKGLSTQRDVLIGGGAERLKERLHVVGPGDLTLSGRHLLLAAPLTLAVQGGIKLPLLYDERPNNNGPPLGSGTVDGEVHLLAGRSLYPLPSYLTGSIGYRRRGGRLHDEVIYAAEVGYTVGRALIKLTLDGVQNTSTPPDIAGNFVVTPLAGGGGVLPDLVVGDQHIVKLSPGIIYEWRQGVSLQAEAIRVVAGTNTLSGTIYSLGLVFSGKR